MASAVGLGERRLPAQTPGELESLRQRRPPASHRHAAAVGPGRGAPPAAVCRTRTADSESRRGRRFKQHAADRRPGHRGPIRGVPMARPPHGDHYVLLRIYYVRIITYNWQMGPSGRPPPHGGVDDSDAAAGDPKRPARACSSRSLWRL